MNILVTGGAGYIGSHATRANKELGWKVEETIEDGCADSWRWQSQNPNGFNAQEG